MSVTVGIHPDEYEIRLFPARDGDAAFAVVKAHEGDGTVTLFLPSPARCDELIKAAAEAKRQLLGEPEQDAAAVIAESIRTGTPVIVGVDETAARCPDCGRASCTGEDCYWPDEAAIRRPGALREERGTIDADAEFAADAASPGELEPLPARDGGAK